MKGKSGFRAIFNSVNPNFYKEISSQSFGRSLGYLVFLMLIIALILSTKIVLDFRKGVTQFSNWIVEKLPEIAPQGIPEIKIEKGEVSSPVEQPSVIGNKEFAFVLDTTGQVTSLDDYKNGILLTKNKLTTKVTRVEGMTPEVNVYELSSMRFNILTLRPGDKQKGEILNLALGDKAFSVSKESIEQVGKKISLILFPFLILASFLYYLLAKLFQVFLFSLLSLIINSLSDAKLKYANLINIGAYAITPPTVLSVLIIILLGAGSKFLFVWALFYIVLYVTFLTLGILQCKQTPGPKAA